VIPWKVGAPIILAMAISACGPSLGAAYEHAFAAGQRAYHAGRYEEAARDFEQAAEKATRVKDRDEALFEVARMHEKRGAYVEAHAAYERITKVSPDGPRAARAAYDMALVEVDHGDAERGYLLLLDATFKYPRHGSARRSLHRLIEHQQELGGDEAVIKWLDGPGRTLRGSELDQQLDYERALTLERMGKTAEARDLFVKTAKDHPYPFGGLTDDALWQASLAEEKLGRYDAAIAHLRTLLADREASRMTGSYERPRYSPAQMRIAELYRDKLHDHRSARKEFHTVYSAHPTSVLRDDALWAEALLAHVGGDASDACSLVTKLRKEFADSRFTRCGHLVCPAVKPAANERPCANYVERQVRGENVDADPETEPESPKDSTDP
jgi:tetratricopeptide (TPR) repeat protein